MTLYLDYRSSLKPIPWAGLALLALALAVLALAGVYYHDTLEQIGYWEAQSGLAERAAGRKMPGSQREINEMVLEIKHANEVLDQITLPWDKLFQAVEWSSGKDVALLTIEPDTEKHEVKISGEAKNIEAVLGYIKHLSTQDVFSSVYLQSHQVQKRNPEKPVRFALVVAWKVTP
jgi:hypothetical protein